MLRVTALDAEYPLDQSRVRALAGVNLEVAAGSFFVLLGPSGCGKTTLLRSVAGLERPTSGSIAIADEAVVDTAKRIFVPPERRQIAMVFQSYAIWPNMTVRQNVEFPLARGVRPVPEPERSKRVDEAIDILGLRPFTDRSVTTLSGGQQQRVAIARAMALRPRMLLMDEPLSNLDYALQARLRVELRDLFKQHGLTVLYVTHNQTEAMEVADSVAVMRDGRIEQIGDPVAIYDRPSSGFVARFMGETNVLPIIAWDAAVGRVTTALGVMNVAAPASAPDAFRHSLVFRPEALSIDGDGGFAIAAVVRQRLYQGSTYLYGVETNGQLLRFRLSSSRPLAVGDQLALRLQERDCRVVVDDPVGGPIETRA